MASTKSKRVLGSSPVQKGARKGFQKLKVRSGKGASEVTIHIKKVEKAAYSKLADMKVVKVIAGAAGVKSNGGTAVSGGGKTGSIKNFTKVKVHQLRSSLELSQPELSRMTGYSLRAIAGWEAGKTVSDSARQKLVETDRLRQALSKIVPAGELGIWLRKPNPAFEGQSPIQVIERGESDRLWRMIAQIDANVAN